MLKINCIYQFADLKIIIKYEKVAQSLLSTCFFYLMNKIYKNPKRNHQRYNRSKNFVQHFQTHESPIATQAKQHLMKFPDFQNTLEIHEWKHNSKQIIDDHTSNISGWFDEKQGRENKLVKLIKSNIVEKQQQTNNNKLSNRSFFVKKEKPEIIKLKSLYQINTVELYSNNFSPFFRRDVQSHNQVYTHQRKKIMRYLPTNASVSNQISYLSKSQRHFNKSSNLQHQIQIKNPEYEMKNSSYKKFPSRRPRTVHRRKNNMVSFQEKVSTSVEKFLNSINKFNKVKTEVKKINRSIKQEENQIYLTQQNIIYGRKVNLK